MPSHEITLEFLWGIIKKRLVLVALRQESNHLTSNLPVLVTTGWGSPQLAIHSTRHPQNIKSGQTRDTSKPKKSIVLHDGLFLIFNQSYPCCFFTNLLVSLRGFTFVSPSFPMRKLHRATAGGFIRQQALQHLGGQHGRHGQRRTLLHALRTALREKPDWRGQQGGWP